MDGAGRFVGKLADDGRCYDRAALFLTPLEKTSKLRIFLLLGDVHEIPVGTAFSLA
jgi:hypothetical protein